MTNVAMSRLAVSALCSLMLAGCFGSSNPLIGKWSLTPGGGDGCPDTLEFTGTSMTTTTGPVNASFDVTYKADGGTTTVTSSTGPSMSFTGGGNAITMTAPESCQYGKAS
jgi:hypothetical protein